MEQKYIHLKHKIIGLASVALIATGCSDNTDEPAPMPVTNVKAGDAVMFTSDANVVSRSIYNEDDIFQIDWVNNDEIGIYSNEAWVGTPRTNQDENDAQIYDGLQYAFYRVTKSPHDEYENEHGSIAPEEADKMMLWSSHDEVHHFYAIYPKSRNLDISERISMKYHTNQECEVAAESNGNYTTKPDMRNAYMVAKNSTSAANADRIILHFDPLMTTLDLTVTAGQYEVGTGIIQPITVTGVSVIMPKYLKNGEFVYNMSAAGTTAPGQHASEWALENVEDGSESVFVGVVDKRDGTTKRYIDLFEGETLKLMAFLPPMDVDQYQIKIHTTSGYDFVKTVKASDLGGAVISKRSRINITLPNIYPDGAEYIGADGTQAKSGNNWISKLPGTTDLKKLSIPGFVCSKNTTAEEIEVMLDHGVRAFDVDALDSKVYTETFNKWIVSHKDEFLIVWVERLSASTWKHGQDWIDFGSDIQSVRGHIIALVNVTGGNFYNSDKTSIFHTSVFDYNKTSDVEISKKWACNYLDGKKDNKSVLSSLFPMDGSELTQTGYTGIVMIPNANVPYDYNKGEYTYSDFLIQGIIDCNYKFNLRK